MDWNLKNSVILLWLGAVLFFIVLKGIIPGWQEGRSDFSNYYYSSVLLANGESISKFYDNDWFNEKAKDVGEKEGAKFAPFPPATAFLYLPLVVFNPLQAKRIWLLFNVSLLFVLIFQLKKLSNLAWIDALLVLSLFCIPIASNFRLGQSYLLFTNFIVLFLLGVKNGKYSLGSSLLGLAAAIKYFPVIYLISAFPKINKKIIFGFASGVIITVLLPFFVDGFSPYHAFISEFWNHFNGDISGQGMYSFTFQSIDVLLANLFIFDAQLNQNPLVNTPILKQVFKYVFAFSILSAIVFSIKRRNKQTIELTAAIVVVGAYLLIPASATYHLLFLLPALVLLLRWLKKKVFYKSKIVGVVILTFVACNVLPHHIPNVDLPTFNVLLHFPRLYSLLALFIFLVFTQSKYFNQDRNNENTLNISEK